MSTYFATDTELTAVADAIRIKGGTTASLTFPNGFVSAINDISGGGIPGGYNVSFSVNGSITKIISVTAGDSIASCPFFPQIGGYHFNGWAATDGGTAIAYPYTPSGNVTLYALLGAGNGATIAGLGSQSPSNVTFNVDSGFFASVVETNYTKSGDTFTKFKKVYRKVNTAEDGQITSITLADTKVDNTYQIYPCFLAEDGTELEYVLMGKYCSTSSSSANSVSGSAATMTIGAGRTLCRARGTGYQQMDWMIYGLWQDLLIARMQTVNTNSGSGISTDLLGIDWGSNYPWIDGVNIVNSGKKYVFSEKPTKYVDEATSSTSDYYEVSYTYNNCISGKEISKLGYDSNHPFAIMPTSTVDNSAFDTYYCDVVYYGSNATHPVFSCVGDSGARCGVFARGCSDAWSYANGVRLCYRPLVQ